MRFMGPVPPIRLRGHRQAQWRVMGVMCVRVQCVHVCVCARVEGGYLDSSLLSGMRSKGWSWNFSPTGGRPRNTNVPLSEDTHTHTNTMSCKHKRIQLATQSHTATQTHTTILTAA